MTPLEFQYLKRAIEALETQPLNKTEEYKVLRTISQITGKAADEIKAQTIDDIENRLYNLNITTQTGATHA